MAQTLYFPDGTHEVIFYPYEDLQRIIRERLGKDAEEMYEGIIQEFENELEDYKETREDYEVNADEYIAMCRDAKGIILEVLTMLKEPGKLTKLNKAGLTKKIEAAYKLIDNTV